MHEPLANHISTNYDLSSYPMTMHETGPIELLPGADGGHQVELNNIQELASHLFPDPSKRWDRDCGYNSLDEVHEWKTYRVDVHLPDDSGSI